VDFALTVLGGAALVSILGLETVGGDCCSVRLGSSAGCRAWGVSGLPNEYSACSQAVMMAFSTLVSMLTQRLSNHWIAEDKVVRKLSFLRAP
jgi:hypothetical protein